MNIFNKPIRNEDQQTPTFLSIGDLQIRGGWLADHPHYHQMVLTSMHLAQLLHHIQFLQAEATETNLFKMAEMNKQINEIVQGNKMYESKTVKYKLEEEAGGKNSQRHFILQKVSGVFNTVYTRNCSVRNYNLYIESKKKGEEVMVDLTKYNLGLEFKADYDAKEQNKADDVKKHFKWLEGFPVRMYLTGEALKPYAIYISKVSKAKELIDYFEMRKSSSSFGKFRNTIKKYAVYFRNNITTAFIMKIQQCANGKFKNAQDVYKQEMKLSKPAFEAQSPTIKPQEDGKTSEAVGARTMELGSPLKRPERGRSIKIDIMKKELHDEEADLQEPFSALIRRRQMTLNKQPDKLMKSPSRKFTTYDSDGAQMSPLKLNSADHQNESQTTEKRKPIPDKSHFATPHEVVEQHFFQEQEAQNHSQFHSSQRVLQDLEAVQARDLKLDSYMELLEICMYIKHFEKKIQLELIQYVKGQVQSQKAGNPKYQIVSYLIEFSEDPKNPMVFIPSFEYSIKVSSSSNLFGFVLKTHMGKLQTLCQFQTKVKYQRCYYKLIHISKVPFAGKIGFMVSYEKIRPIQRLSAVQFIEQFLRTNDYEAKYLFNERGRAINEVDSQFKEKVWMKILDFPDDEQLIEKQVFLGIPDRIRSKFISLLTRNKNEPSLQSLVSLDYHQVRLVKQSLPFDLIGDLQAYIIIDDLIQHLLKFKCNANFKQRLLGIAIFCKYKLGQCHNVVYILIYQIFKNLQAILLKHGKDKETILKIFDLYYELQHDLDGFFGEVYNYL